MKAQGDEDGEELRPERRLVLVLNGVEPVAREERQPQLHADLRLIDDDEEDDHQGRQPALVNSEGGERLDARGGAARRVEIAVADARHLPHDRDEGDRVNENGEDRDGERQAFGQRVILQRFGPEADLRNQEDDAEDDRFDREDRREDAQEAGDFGRLEGGVGAKQPGRGEQQDDPVPVLRADYGGDDREDGDDGGENMHGLPYVSGASTLGVSRGSG